MNDMTIQYISPRIGDIYKTFVDEKRKSGFSTEKISELSGVPYNFLTRFLVGQVVNPSFEYVATLCACRFTLWPDWCRTARKRLPEVLKTFLKARFTRSNSTTRNLPERMPGLNHSINSFCRS